MKKLRYAIQKSTKNQAGMNQVRTKFQREVPLFLEIVEFRGYYYYFNLFLIPQVVKIAGVKN